VTDWQRVLKGYSMQAVEVPLHRHAEMAQGIAMASDWQRVLGGCSGLLQCHVEMAREIATAFLSPALLPPLSMA